jgi:ubiquitin C-terminal hydrolase
MKRKQIGLTNSGNNCFFNSVLQLLFDCTVLNKYITSNNIDGTVVNIYKDFLNEYNEAKDIINPSKITRYISLELNRTRNTQEDSDVYLTYIFDHIISEINDDIAKKNLKDTKNIICRCWII